MRTPVSLCDRSSQRDTKKSVAGSRDPVGAIFAPFEQPILPPPAKVTHTADADGRLHYFDRAERKIASHYRTSKCSCWLRESSSVYLSDVLTTREKETVTFILICSQLWQPGRIIPTLSITLSTGSGRRSLGHLTPTSHLAKESVGRGGETIPRSNGPGRKGGTMAG